MHLFNSASPFALYSHIDLCIEMRPCAATTCKSSKGNVGMEVLQRPCISQLFRKVLG